MIKLSNGHILKYIASSGSLGFDCKGWLWEKPLIWTKLIDLSLFTMTAKTITWLPINIPLYKEKLQFVDGGVINSFKLGNIGAIKWYWKYGKKISFNDKIIVSIAPFNVFDAKLLACLCNKVECVAIEINISCPNIEEKYNDIYEIIYIINTIYQYTKHPIIVKVSVDTDIEKLLPAIKNIIEAITLNSVPFNIWKHNLYYKLYARVEGALSGGWAKQWNWPLADRINRMNSIPVVYPDIWYYNDIEEAFNKRKAKAISFGSLFLRHPTYPTNFIQKYEKELM